MSLVFRTGAEAAKEARPRGSGIDFTEMALMPDSEKERLCRNLLGEFGVTRISTREPDGELIHCCTLPGHDEKNPSASLNYKKLVYRCLGCGSRGGLLWYIATCRGEDTKDSVDWLRGETGIGGEQTLTALLDFFDAVYEGGTDYSMPIPRMSEKVLEPYMLIHPWMTDPPPDGRGIPEDTMRRFKVGYGTIRVRDVMGEWTDSERILIPHWWQGDLVGWQSRRLFKSDGTAKYMSTPDFPKDKTLFNHGSEDWAVIAESPMSVLTKAHLDPPIVATFGASITDRQIRLLAGYQRVVLFMDNDEAGWKATEALIDALEAYSNVFVVESPWAADPGDMDDTTYLDLVNEATPASLWTRPSTLTKWAA